MTRMCMSKFLNCQIECLAQHLQPAKCIAKEQNVIMKPTQERYGSTADRRSEKKEFMIKVPQAMFQFDAYEKLLQCEFTDLSYRNEYQCVPDI